jgi:para-nitrobenzyl esterase
MLQSSVGRRDVLKSAAALFSAGIVPGLESQTSAQSRDQGRIVFSDANAVVETATGRVRGYSDGDIHVFKGIPYAAPPTGRLRFMPPEKPKPWADVRNSLQYGPACPQAAGRADDLNQFFFEFDRGYLGEDCLSVNVWTPGVKDNKKRPVLFWLHGGGFNSGSSFELPSYDGRNLARRGDVVVVSINHRLNAFGFLYLAEFNDRFADSVNVGMLDIVAALGWVRENIGMFGGDVNNVTVFGQSGGGAKVNFLMAMPSARGLFHKAIAQSATPMISNPRSIDFSARHTAALLGVLGLTRSAVDELQNVQQEALRAAYMTTYFRVEFEQDALARWNRLTAADLTDIAFDARQAEAANAALGGLLRTRYGWTPTETKQEVERFSSRRYSDNSGPIADGRLILQPPFNPMAPAMSAHVPMIVGHTLNEGGGPNFFSSAREMWTDADVRMESANRPTPVSPGVLEALRSAYPNAKPVEIYAHTVGQGGLRYRIETIRQAARRAAQRAAPAYIYTFAWKTDVLEGRPRAFHRSEIPFVFDNTDRCAHQTGGTEQARLMAAKISDAWVAFARTGNPNHSGIPTWPEFSPERAPTMYFDNTSDVRYDHDRAARQAFEKG